MAVVKPVKIKAINVLPGQQFYSSSLKCDAIRILTPENGLCSISFSGELSVPCVTEETWAYSWVLSDEEVEVFE